MSTAICSFSCISRLYQLQIKLLKDRMMQQNWKCKVTHSMLKIISIHPIEYHWLYPSCAVVHTEVIVVIIVQSSSLDNTSLPIQNRCHQELEGFVFFCIIKMTECYSIDIRPQSVYCMFRIHNFSHTHFPA